MTRIRTLEFLPDIFQTPTNAQFLSATLDQLVNPPVTEKIQGYVGSKFGYGINAKDFYVTEPTKTRTDYQLDPGVVFTKPNESTPTDFISYPGIVDALAEQNAPVANNSRLFESEFYSWDSFANLDKIINYNEYYWLPEGMPNVRVRTDPVFKTETYIVTNNPNSYDIRTFIQGSENPTLTLLRGGQYQFIVDQNSQFWIQGVPGLTGINPIPPFINTREVFGVSNNGASQGVIIFDVPQKDAQDEYDFPGNNLVDVVSTIPFESLNGALVNNLGGIDGVTSLEGLRVLFYNTGIDNEIGFVQTFYSETDYDKNSDIIVEPLTLPIQSTTHWEIGYSEEVSSTGLIEGQEYTIVTIGTTDFTLVGAASNTIGLSFVATGPTSGTGTATVAYDTDMYGENINYLTVAAGNDTSKLTVGQAISFDNPTLGGIVAGQVYFIYSILDSYSFTIGITLGGDPIEFGSDTGNMIANINQGLLEEGYYTTVNANFYRIEYVGDPTDPVIRLINDGLIPTNQKITASFGNQYIARNFYRNVLGYINIIPYLSAPLDTLYYQDGTTADKVGVIKLIESNQTNTIDVDRDIIGQTTYTGPNGVVFTNGLKVSFDGDVVPVSYLQGEYYVEGVGSSITLVPTFKLLCPEPYTSSRYIPYDTTPYDIGNYDNNLFIPVIPDYITIARNALNLNAWSRSNRWFHIGAISASATYNNNPAILTTYATYANKAKRPIIEFYPNLKLFDSGTVSKSPIDFLDYRATNAFTEVAGQENYYPDVAAYTTNTVTINGTGSPATTTTLTVDISAVSGILAVGQYIQDSLDVLPTNTTIKEIETGVSQYTITVEWEFNETIATTTDASFLTGTGTINSYAVFPGARIIFASDTDENVRRKVYEVQFVTIAPYTTPVITLVETGDGILSFDDHIIVLRGYNNQGKGFYYDGLTWNFAQQKLGVNQPPLFDVFDDVGVSFSNREKYTGSSFVGNKLFAYGIGVGLDDSILGFPIRYSSVDNVGDISFDVSLNLDTFTYVNATDPITQKVSTGYVHNYTGRETYVRELGWQTAVGPSVQYQLFQFDYLVNNPTNIFVCDIPALSTSDIEWPVVQVYINNIWQSPNKYFVSTDATSTTINLTIDEPVDTVVQVLLLSNQTSFNAYYTIPINLSNNPFNTNIETANIGDIRAHYRSIFINTPGMQGEVFGDNNFRDLGNLVPYGNAIIQNSASNVLPGVFLRKQNQNLFDALLFNSREYINYKQLIVDTVNNLNIDQTFTPSDVLDSALEIITKSKTSTQAFFWSDMLPGKAAYIINSYTFKNDFSTSNYPLSKIYDFATANYNGVLVYLNRLVEGVVVQSQLIRNVDYIVSETSPSLTISIPLQANDVVTIKEYNQTYGSFAPNTPSKLGLYPAFVPEIVLDSTYLAPTYFIKGHDGSYTKLYGDYNNILNTLIDFRDQALFEFEKRVYNNLKLSSAIPIEPNTILPGYFRTTDLSYTEFLDVYTPNFLNWVGQNRLDYKTQYYINNNEYTYNYTDSGNKLDNQPILQGNFRGVYQYFYDTSEPNYYPWEMLGLSEKPSWWETRYGPSPYTSENNILWNDLEQGINWNNGDPYVIPAAVRPNLTKILPVDTAGKLVSPFVSIVGNYDKFMFRKNWKVGDVGPVEFAYRRSSTWPFDLMKILALTKPSQFFNLGVDIDRYKYNNEFNQYLIDNRRHLVVNEIDIYGTGTPVTSYLNWIVDYEKQLGTNGTDRLQTLLDNLDVRLVYRLAGFSDKKLLKFYVEKGSPNSTNASLLIPDESYSVLLYDNQPFDKIIYSGVVIQRFDDGFAVYGNSQETAYFTTLAPVYDGFYDNITVENLTVKVTNNYSKAENIVPYGTLFYTAQELSQFLASYGAYLTSTGMVFNTMENGVEINWRQMIGEFLYWAQTGWEVGSIITINPSANEIRIDKPNSIVQPLTLQKTNFILNQNLYPINLNNLSIIRDDTAFICTALNNGDALAYGQFSFSNFEHGIVFDNITLFDDVVYNLITGLRQNRITVRGVKSAEWNGTVNASGFILNQDNILEWDRTQFYTKGVIVKFKNKYWTSLRKIEPSPVFNELYWKETEYDEIQKGLLPNSSTRSYESTLYYDVNQTNLEQDANLLGFSLIGYRPRDYLSLVDLTDITQVNVYKNLIKSKGTKNSLSAFKGANLPQGGIDYEVYENWAIKIGEFGGVLNDNFIEYRLNENLLTGNPSISSLTTGTYTPGSQQEVPLYSLFNYGRPVENVDVLPVLPTYTPPKTFPTAGYVNFNDVKMSGYFYSSLSNAVDKAGVVVPIENFYVRNYVWLANYLQDWQVYSWNSIGEIIEVVPNLNNTCTVRFLQPHNLTRLDPIAIINFSPLVNGYYFVNEVVSLNEITITLALANNSAILTGQGVGLSFVSQRVDTPSDIINLPLLNAEFIKNTVWVDNDYDGDWAVFRKSINYQRADTLIGNDTNSFGTAVAYTSKSGYIITDPYYSVSEGRVYTYKYNTFIQDYEVVQTITGDNSFGYSIAHAGQTYVISQPINTPVVQIYIINNTRLSEQMFLAQSISAPAGSTNWGQAVEISNDTNWLYISDIDNSIGNYRQNVYVYRKDNISYNAGYFVPGSTYEITSVGTTDFTVIGAISSEVGIKFIAGYTAPGEFISGEEYTIYNAGTTNFTLIGAPNNNVGTTFTASFVGADPTIGTGSAFNTAAVGTGTGVATQITYKHVNTIIGTSLGDDFGKSIATDYNGDTVVIGAPGKDYSAEIENWGRAHIYQRTVQNIEVQTNSLPNQPQQFTLGWIPTTLTFTATNFAGTTITVSPTTAGLVNVNDPIVFTGADLAGTGIEAYKTYYINSASVTSITIKSSRNSSTAVPVNIVSSVSVVATIQSSPLYVTVNGTNISDSNYVVIGNKLFYTGTIRAGDIINVSGNQFTLIQTVNSQYTARVGAHFGNSVDITRQSSEIIIGAPFELNDDNIEGAVYRYTNGGARYGNVLGTEECNVTAIRKLFVNGFLVFVPIGNATTTATAINQTGIPNVQASYSADNKLYISVINSDLAIPNEKLLIAVEDITTLTELGINVYTQTQIVECPHNEGSTQFGYTVKFNEFDSFIASAPVGSRYEATTFDFTDDENLDNDTIFDNNATQFIDSYPNAGAVYMFDYLPSFNESLNSPGNYIYAQSMNSVAQVYDSLPMYGKSLDFNDNRVIVGSPDFYTGEVLLYENSVGLKDWYPYRKSSPIVNIEKIENAQIFSATTNNTLVNLDYFDPLQGKLLGAVQQNIDFVTNVDPARYNSADSDNIGVVWGKEYVGRVWFDTTNVRFVNYHQNDVVYNSAYWGTLFPGSDVAVYTWVESPVLPNNYIGPGTVLDPTLYSIEVTVGATNTLTPLYYFWVRNTGLVDRKIGKTLADTVIERYISNPIQSGISYFSPLLPNSFALYNSGMFLNGTDSVFHLGYSVSTSADIGHTEFTLIRSNFADDFLPGVPPYGSTLLPTSLYDRLLDSLAGVDEVGSVVPNPFLPRAVQSGVQVRPRQSFFYDRLEALKNYFTYANTVLKQFPITEIRQAAFPYLLAKNPATPTFAEGEEYNTANYWEYINWWAPGYDDNTKSAFTVQYYADLSTLSVDVNTIVTVGINSNGNQETYIYNDSGNWVRIGLENGTIRLKESLYNYPSAKFGFGDNFYDTSQFDIYPSTETRYITRALNEEIYTEELLIFRNKSLILLFEYIQTETTESQNFLPWLSKTSLVDVTHTIRELVPLEVFQTDNQDFLAGYLNEVKPYHVVIKDFLFKYTGTELYEGDITDFDLPSQYNSTVEKFISPQLVYTEPANAYEYLPTNEIWQTRPYNQWFLNRGLSLGNEVTIDGETSIIGEPSYLITNLLSYVNQASSVIFLDNTSGLPINGVLKIGNEYIGYSFVDRSLNYVGNLLRGLFESPIEDHIPGDPVIIDLPPVIVFDGGRAYTQAPKVTAYVNPLVYPLPTRPAQLEAIMSLDRVISINVIDPGQGYMVQPEIVIEAAQEVEFGSSAVNTTLNTITIYAPELLTGDLVQYKVNNDSTSIGGLVHNQWYYISLLQSTPTFIIALYNTYGDAINDNDRVRLYTVGSGTFTLALGARAYAITSAQPVRENVITLRYDRTTYRPQVLDWESGAYYGGFFAGRYSNSERVASSSIILESTQPAISDILASAEGVAFEIVDVTNDQTVTYSSFIREVYEVQGYDPDPNESDFIRLKPLDGTGDPFNFEPNASGLTLGFYVGMPIKFQGDVGGNITADTVYYVLDIINQTDFTISLTPNGTKVTLNDYTSLGTMACLVGEVVNKAIVTVNYPDILTVTNTQTGTNKLTVPLSSIGTGGTTGFYVNVPVEFVGDVFGNIVENQIYYITTVADEQTFTLSKNPDPLTTTVLATNSSNNSITVESVNGFNLGDAIIINNIIIPSGQLIIGETYVIKELNGTDFVALGATENLKGLSFVATDTGSELAEDFTVGLNYVITSLGDTEWNDVANTTGVIYVVGDVILALNPNLATGTTGTGAQGLGTVVAKNFGNLNSGQTYYVSAIPNASSLILSQSLNGTVVTLQDQQGQALLTSQADTLPLSTATGSMTMNVGLPVSPGQVNGQRFTFYETSSQIIDPVTNAVENLITKVVTATLGDGTSSGENKLAIKSSFSGLSNFYVNMPMEVADNIGTALFAGQGFVTPYLDVTSITSGKIYIGGTVTDTGGLVALGTIIVSQISGDPGMPGLYLLNQPAGSTPIGTNMEITATLTSSTVYRVIEFTGRYNPETQEYTPKLQVTCSTTSSTGNVITCDSTTQLYEGMPIIFSGQGLGRIIATREYFVKSIVSATTFTISEVLDGTTFILENDNGIMIGTGDSYIQIANPLVDYDPVILSTVVDEFDITQTPQQTAAFDISYILGGYRAIITNQGLGYAVNNTITIDGLRLGGTTPKNNLTLTVNSVDSKGGITSVIRSGTVPSVANNYYLKVISPTQFEVYSNSLMNLPVSGINFPYTGVISTTATQVKASGTGGWTSDSVVVVSNLSDFSVNDGVMFTGAVLGNIQLGQTYYIIAINTPNNEIIISEIPSGVAYNVGVATGLMTMAKPGSFMLLPEPFYFNQSIVKFNNRAYICVVSNNDSEFIFGKWQELDSGDRRLNALDRVISYYQPTVDMPGVDVTQLFEGVTYPNSTYFGNPFAPAQQYPLDTVLQDAPFYPTNVDVTSVLYDGNAYLATANVPNEYSAIIASEEGTEWAINKLSNTGIGTTDIIKGDSYVMTSRNTATPIYRSNDGINWTTNGYYTPYGATPYDDVPFDMTALSIAALSLNSVAYNNGLYVAVGGEVVTSDDTYIWRNTYTFPTVEWNNAVLRNELFSVTYVNLPTYFNGFVAVGVGETFDYSTGLTQTIPTSIIMISQNGYNWNVVPGISNKGFYAVATNGTKIIAAGEEGVIYYSENGTNWYGVNQTSVISVLTTTNIINVTSTIGLTVNDPISFDKSFSSVLANTVYYVHTVLSPVQIKISDTLGGSELVLTLGAVLDNTYLRKLPITENINDLIYINNKFTAVGNNGLIRTSTDGITWTTQTSGVTTDLYGITFRPEELVDPYVPNTYTVVGKENTIIQSIDDGITWQSASLFTVTPTLYDVQGDAFTSGYAPEELVPGVVEDNLTMIVTTRPGTNWPAYQYGHVGYNVVSLELTPTSGSQTIYSFERVVQYPVHLNVFVINGTTGLSTTLYADAYTIDWVNSLVILDTPISYLPVTDQLRIDVYEVGNGDQLVKSSTKADPIIENSVTGFQEIFLNCNYSENINNGSGVLRPDQLAIDVLATSTDAIADAIYVEDISKFIVNGVIYFQGNVFGNVQEDTPYYVKTVDTIGSSITISNTYNLVTGIAGPIFSLSTATGEMRVIISSGSSAVWTDPLVVHNGTKLALGVTGNVTRTKVSNNRITTNTTGGMTVGSKIKFSDTMFGVVTPQTTYYIANIYDNNEFVISENQFANVAGTFVIGQKYVITSLGTTDFTTIGASANTVGIQFVATGVGTGTGTAYLVYGLTNSTGGASFVTDDFALGIGPNGIGAKIILADDYDNTLDYIVYTIFGESEPIQYGYTVPETQTFVGDGSTYIFNLDNYVGGLNPNNAIVEIDGLRLTNSQYILSGTGNTLTLVNPPTSGQIVAVTSFSNTERQYINTQFNFTGETGQVTGTVTVGATVLSEVSYDEIEFNISVTNLIIGQSYQISDLGTTTNTQWNIIAGTSNIPSTTLIASVTYKITFVGTTNWNAIGYIGIPTVGGTFTSTGNITGTGTADIVYVVGDQITCNASGTGTGVCDLVIGFDSQVLSMGYLDVGSNYSINTLGNTTNNEWNTIAGTTGVVYVVGSTFTCAYNGLGYGTGTVIGAGYYDEQRYYLQCASTIVSATGLTIGQTYEIYSLGSTNWNIVAGTTGIVYEVGDLITCEVIGSGTGQCIYKYTTGDLYINAPVVFSEPVLYSIIPNVAYYVIDILNAYQFTISTMVGGTPVITSGYFAVDELEIGVDYEIYSLGTTTQTDWNTIAGTTGITYVVGDEFTCATVGTGTGICVYSTSYGPPNMVGTISSLTVSEITDVHNQISLPRNVTFATNTVSNTIALTDVIIGERILVTNITIGETYTIVTLGSTDFTLIGAASNTVGLSFTATGVGIGTGTVIGPDEGDDLFIGSGTVSVGMVISDIIGILPNTYITLGSGQIWKVNLSQSVSSASAYATSFFIEPDSVANFVAGQTVMFKSAYLNVSELLVGKEYQIFSLGDTSQSQWNSIAGGSPGETYAVGDIFTCAAAGSGTGTCLLSNFGGLSTLGQVYFLATYQSSYFVVEDQYGNIVPVTNDSGNVQVVVGGDPAVRITTAGNHNLETNDFVRIDGVVGSVQLNNNTYYVHVITNTVVDLYFTPYLFAATAANTPVENVATYVSGGNMWLDNLFTIADTFTYSTSSITDKIYVNSIDNFIIGTPVYFAQVGYRMGETILGGLIVGEEYYVSEIFEAGSILSPITAGSFVLYETYIINSMGTTNWNIVAGTSDVSYAVGDYVTAVNAGSGTGTALIAPAIRVSETRFGSNLGLTNDKDAATVTQWEQENPDRLWVTVNGYRVPSSKLRLNQNNNLSILMPIDQGDQVIVTSMIPTATPNEEVYMLNVNQINEPEVFKTNVYTKTWVTQNVYQLIDTIYVDDVRKITYEFVQNETAPIPIDDRYSIGLIANKRAIASITVYNETKNVLLNEQTYYVELERLSPVLKIITGSFISPGDSLVITTLQGNLIYINGEQIQFDTVNIADNSISGLVRGSNGTGEQSIIPKYSEVYGLLNSSIMSENNYDDTWNSDNYNVIEGDPLQISTTNAALFLRSTL